MRHKVGNAVVGVRKIDDSLLKGKGFGCHESIIRQVA
jgi:hypothetical protein